MNITHITQKTSGKPRRPSRLCRTALLFIIHTSSFILSGILLAAPNDPLDALRTGLFEEEVNRNLEAAITAYQSVVTQLEPDRKLAVTAVFRLGECYRKLDRTNEAVVQYQRVLRDFSDQTPFVTLSRQELGKLGAPPPGAGAGTTATVAVSEAANLLAAQLAGLDKLKHDPEERARAVLALFPDEDLRTMLLNLNKLHGQEADLKADPKRKDYAMVLAFGLDFSRPDEGVEGMHWHQNATPPEIAEDQLKAQRLLIAQRADFILGLQKARLQALQAAAGSAAPGETTAGSTAASEPASEQREIQRIQTLLAQSPDLINAPGKNGETLLQAAAGKGQLDVVQFLLDHGAAVNGIEQPGLTPLHFAAGNGHLAVVDLLLRRGAKPDRATRDGVTPLHLAALKGYAQVAKALIDAGAPLNVRTFPGNTRTVSMSDLEFLVLSDQTPLDMALYSAFQNIVELLITAKADLNARDDRGETALFRAVFWKQRAMVQLLLDHGADPNLSESNGSTPLGWASGAGDLEIVSLLLAHKADVNAKAKSVEGYTPLHAAANVGHTAVVEALLAASADVNARDAQGETPLLLAVQEGQDDVVAALLRSKADPNLADEKGTLPLRAAIWRGDQAVVKDLLEHGAAVAGKNPDGRTLLALAVSTGNTNVMETLLEHGADVNAKSRGGSTPLDFAVGYPTTAPLSLLLAHSVAVNAVDDFGRTALEYLKQSQPPAGLQSLQAEMAAMLRAHGAQDWVPRPGQITVTRRSTGVAYSVFRQGTNALNHFTLFEAIAALPWGRDNPYAAVVPFPDFSKVTITRRDPKTGKLTDIPVDAAALVAASDCSKDMSLEWGDLVNIPDREHTLNEQWQGLPLYFATPLAKCLARKVTVEVKGQPQTIDVYGSPVLTDKNEAPTIRLPFHLQEVLTGSARLLSTSDLTRVTVRRVDPATGQPREWVFNEQTMDFANDLWVRDGDVIAVPEK